MSSVSNQLSVQYINKINRFQMVKFHRETKLNYLEIGCFNYLDCFCLWQFICLPQNQSRIFAIQFHWLFIFQMDGMKNLGPFVAKNK